MRGSIPASSRLADRRKRARSWAQITRHDELIVAVGPAAALHTISVIRIVSWSRVPKPPSDGR
jgi:hypothetical protein